MPSKQENEQGYLDIYMWTWGKVPITELKEWVDAQIEKGETHVKLDISWGHYNDIDGLSIEVEKKR
jgi:hypothetical protein